MHPSESRPDQSRPQTAAPWMAPSGTVQTVAPTSQATPPLASYPPVTQGYPPAGQGFPPSGQGFPPSGPPQVASYPPAPGQGSGSGGQPPYDTSHLAEAPAPHRRNRLWLPVTAAAAGAAVLASVGTAGLLGAFDTQDSATTASLASLSETSSSASPVVSATGTTPDWEAVAAAVRPSVVAIEVQVQGGVAEGSGVIIDSAGNIITNNHVVEGAVDGGITVTLSDGRVYQAAVVGTDPTTDLAVIALTDPPADLTPATIGDSDSVQVGEAVMAVGNPLGLSSTATTGIVSALDRPVSTSDGGSTVVTNAIQIDAAVNPGNSGGPLFNSEGQVIGITSSIASLSSSSGSIGLGFAIPSNLAERVASELLEDGSASHAFLGVSLSDGEATADGVTRRGAVIEQITDGSPAAGADLQVGDVVVAIDGNPVNGAESLTGYVRELASGDGATLTVVRDGSTFTVDVTFAALSTGSQ